MAKKFLSAIMALSMAACTFAGCSDLDKDGNLKEAFSYKTVTNEELGISYKVRSDFLDADRILSDIEDATTGDMYVYDFQGDVIFSISPWMAGIKMNTQTKIDWRKVAYFDYENIADEIIEDEEYDIIIFAADHPQEDYENSEEETPTRFMDFIISSEGHPLDNFGVQATFAKDKDEKLMRELGLEMLRSVEYIGEESTTEPVLNFDCDYFSIELPSDEFKFRYSDFDELENNKQGIKYRCSENLAQYMSGITIKALTDSEYTSAEEYLKDTCDEFINKESDVEHKMIEEVSETEILGYDGYRAAYKSGAWDGYAALKKTHYAFEKDDMIYSICCSVREYNGHEQVEADFEKLIDSIVIK
ncbi:MAG: hypothetical protein IKK66_01765 [Ruminococcus sp.]|nr:hypothetical protein [Ruminococcus sp.]